MNSLIERISIESAFLVLWKQYDHIASILNGQTSRKNIFLGLWNLIEIAQNLISFLN